VDEPGDPVGCRLVHRDHVLVGSAGIRVFACLGRSGRVLVGNPVPNLVRSDVFTEQTEQQEILPGYRPIDLIDGERL
jgi:hypothetical protein